MNGHVRWNSRLQHTSPPVTPDDPLDDGITTNGQFEIALGRLLTEAVRNEVDPRGTWEYRRGDGLPDWEAMIVELEKPDAAE